MKYACIDVGTNSIRLLFAEFENGKIHSRFKKLRVTRLGKGVAETRMLDPHRMIESLDTIDEFYKEAFSLGARQVFVFATSAVRDAYNGIDFRQMIYNKTDAEVEIISGNMEAELGFMGVKEGIPSESDYLIFDIGGGSTELILGRAGEMIDAISIDIGGVRLTGSFVDSDPVSAENIKEIREYTQSQLKRVKKIFKGVDSNSVIGIGGTATTFIAIKNKLGEYCPDEVHGEFITKEEIQKINKMLQSMDLESRKQIIGLAPERADIIIAGGLILEGILDIFGAVDMQASDFDNLEGYLVKKTKKEIQ